MTDCFQPLETQSRVAYNTILELNKQRIGYLIVTKSHLIAEPEYLAILDPKLAHIQITVTCMDDKKALTFEKASVPSQRIQAILKLQSLGFDVAIRLSPIIEELMDFDDLNSLEINKCIVEFLRINSWIKQWFQEIDFKKYTLRHGGYLHLPLEEKLRIMQKIHIPDVSVCEDVTEHYIYWRDHFNPNKEDCCNLRI